MSDAQMYVVTKNDGTILGKNVSKTEAMSLILSYDNYDYEIVKENERNWRLHVTDNSKCTSFWRWTETKFTVDANDEKEAEQKMADIIISKCHNWKPYFFVHTSEHYNQYRNHQTD